MIVLKRLTPRVAGRLPSAAHAAREEVVEAVEVQHAAIPRIEEAVHVGPAEFVAGLQRVASRGVRDVREGLRVDVHPAARHGRVGADRRIAGDADQGQTEVARVGDGVEPNRPGVEAAVFREEVFVEPVVAAAQLDQQS